MLKMARPRLERRYSADHIRQQPEFKFLTSGDHGQFSKVAVSIDELQNRRTNDSRNVLKRRASVGHFVSAEQLSSVTKATPRRPKPAFKSQSEAEPEMNVLHKAERRFSSVSAVPRFRTSGTFSQHFTCHGCPGDDADEDPCRHDVNVTSKRRSLPASRENATSSEPAGRPRAAVSSPSQHRVNSAYDAKLEKSTSFLYGKDKSFSKTSKDLSHTGPGIRNLQLHYTETNTSQNDGIIFADLLRLANYRNYVVSESVYGLEKRLYAKRADPARATTFFDKRPDAFAVPRDRTRPRTVAQKKKERKEKIKEKNEEIKLGYVPTARTLTIPGPEEIEELRKNCRYLRIDPKHQTHLYAADVGLSSASLSKADVNLPSATLSKADVKKKKKNIVLDVACKCSEEERRVDSRLCQCSVSNCGLQNERDLITEVGRGKFTNGNDDNDNAVKPEPCHDDGDVDDDDGDGDDDVDDDDGVF